MKNAMMPETRKTQSARTDGRVKNGPMVNPRFHPWRFAQGVSLLRIVWDGNGDGLQLEFKKEGYQ